MEMPAGKDNALLRFRALEMLIHATAQIITPSNNKRNKSDCLDVLVF